MPPLILASASPIRRRLLETAGVPHLVRPAAIDEEKIRSDGRAGGGRIDLRAAGALARRLARAKAAAAAREVETAVLGADQILLIEGRMLGKPGTRRHARDQLAALEGRAHHLVTAAAVVKEGKVLWEGVRRARLDMRLLGHDAIEAYLDEALAAGETILESVGTYHFEGRGVRLFERVRGDYFTILGLPLLPLLRFLREAGLITP